MKQYWILVPIEADSPYEAEALRASVSVKLRASIPNMTGNASVVGAWGGDSTVQPMSREEVIAALATDGVPYAAMPDNSILAWFTGPVVSYSPVETDYLVKFIFNDDILLRFSIEKRLIGP